VSIANLLPEPFASIGMPFTDIAEDPDEDPFSLAVRPDAILRVD